MMLRLNPAVGFQNRLQTLTRQGRLVSSFLFLLELPRALNRIVVAQASSPVGSPLASRRGDSFRQRDPVGTRSRDDCATNQFMESLAPPDGTTTEG